MCIRVQITFPFRAIRYYNNFYIAPTHGQSTAMYYVRVNPGRRKLNIKSKVMRRPSKDFSLRNPVTVIYNFIQRCRF